MKLLLGTPCVGVEPLIEKLNRNVFFMYRTVVLCAALSLGLNPSSDEATPHHGLNQEEAIRWRTLGGEVRTAAAADTLVRSLMAEHNVGAISVAVVQEGQVVFSAVHGEVRPGRPVDTSTVFRAASLGKPVFAYLVLRLVDEGIIDLDNPIASFLPGGLAAHEHYRDIAIDPRSRGLTVRRILSHQTGLPNWHRSGPVSFVADPGTQFGYSGEGYALLQLVVEERTGKAVNELAMEKLFEPLGMTNSSFVWESRFDEHFAVDPETGLRRLVRQTRLRANVAGSLITNAADYARFLQAVMDGYDLDREHQRVMFEQQIPISSRSLFSPPGTDTGYAEAMQLGWTVGWGRFVSEYGVGLFHVGREEGCEGYAVIFLQAKTALVVMSVSSLQSTFTGALTAGLLGDDDSPLEWLEYGTTGEAPATGRLSCVWAIVTLLGVLPIQHWLRVRRGSRLKG